MRTRRLKTINVIEEMGMNHGTAWEDDFSVGNAKNQASAVALIDEATREVKPMIKHKHPIILTGKFNVFNTRNDVY